MTGARLVVRDATEADFAAMVAIYNVEVLTGIATFDTEAAPPSKFTAYRHPGRAALVAEFDQAVVGYATSGPYRPKPAYDLTREVSVYVDAAARGRGVARALYDVLHERLREQGMHSAVAVLALPNDASAALHEACGYRFVGSEREVGRKFDRWIDTATWQKLL